MASLGDNEITNKQIYCLWCPLQDAFAGNVPYYDIFAAFWTNIYQKWPLNLVLWQLIKSDKPFEYRVPLLVDDFDVSCNVLTMMIGNQNNSSSN